VKNLLKPAFSLLFIAAAVTGLLVAVNAFTAEPIENQLKKTRENTMREALPLAAEFTEVETEKSGSVVAVYEGFRKTDETVGFVIELIKPGYSGGIHMMVGISSLDDEITGMRIVRHTETPGLGARATNESFYKRFDGLPLSPLSVSRIPSDDKNKIDALTGATITTQAIVDAVNEAVSWRENFRGEGR